MEDRVHIAVGIISVFFNRLLQSSSIGLMLLGWQIKSELGMK